MSRPKSSCGTPLATRSPCVGKSSEDGACERERVVKEVGLTSSTFIGPTFPSVAATKKSKSDIEDKLSDFYKELEKIETPDWANGKQETLNDLTTIAHNQDISQREVDNASRFAQTDGCWKSRGQKQLPWPHWHRNEPYHPRRPRPDMDPPSDRAVPDPHWRHYPPPPNRPPDPRLHRPLFHHPHCSPAFPHPQNPPPHVNPTWSGSEMTHRYPKRCHFPMSYSIPSPNVYSPTTQELHREYPHHFDRDKGACNNDSFSNNGNVERFTTRQEEWYGFDQDYDRRHDRFISDDFREQQHPCRPPENTHANHSPLVLILMRGLPGSGKSTLARELLFKGPNGLILGTDDYFAYEDGYRYEPHLLGVAHDWNHSRAKGAMQDRRSPIIIDNTNVEAWEMKPYVKMAMENGYKVDFCEPDTSWKLDTYELEKRNKHGVSQEKIAKMLKHFSFRISIDIVMSSQEPPHVKQRSEQPHTRGPNRDLH